MFERRYWKTSHTPATTSWNWKVRFWRVQVQLTIHRHGHPSSDRWVAQPHFIYDRKATGGRS